MKDLAVDSSYLEAVLCEDEISQSSMRAEIVTTSNMGWTFFSAVP
jgi:hypothetical protein